MFSTMRVESTRLHDLGVAQKRYRVSACFNGANDADRLVERDVNLFFLSTKAFPKTAGWSRKLFSEADVRNSRCPACGIDRRRANSGAVYLLPGEPVSRALPSISLHYRLLTLIYRTGAWVVCLGVDSWSWDVITSRSIVSPSLHTVVESRLPVSCVSLQKNVAPFLTFGL
jgi:hypothetical protein